MQYQMGEKIMESMKAIINEIKEGILPRILAFNGKNSVRSLAKVLRMNPQTVDNYVSKRRKISLDFIIAICYSRQVSADYLLGFTDDPKGTAAPVTDPAIKAKLAEKDAEIARLNGIIEGLRFAFTTTGKGK
jgi:transcriptional regulator with XRE-family HTH domain